MKNIDEKICIKMRTDMNLGKLLRSNIIDSTRVRLSISNPIWRSVIVSCTENINDSCVKILRFSRQTLDSTTF